MYFICVFYYFTHTWKFRFSTAKNMHKNAFSSASLGVALTAFTAVLHFFVDTLNRKVSSMVSL